MYKIDPNLLEFGDIILMKADDDLSRRVRSDSNSQFSHVMLYVGWSTYVDSTFNGVQANHIQRFIFESSEDVKVLRLIDHSLKKRLNQVTDFAREKVGTEYSIREAFESIKTESQFAKQPNRQFCTRFVTQAYQAAQIELTINVDYPVPEDILNSDLLLEVPNISVLATQDEIEYLENESPVEVLITKRNEFYKKIRHISGQDIQTTDQLTSLLINHSELDEQITTIARGADFFTLMNERYAKYPENFDVNNFIEFYGNKDSIISAAKNVLTTEIPLNEGLRETLKSLTELNKEYHRKYFDFQLDLIKLSQSKSDLRLKVAKEVWRKYVGEDFNSDLDKSQF